MSEWNEAIAAVLSRLPSSGTIDAEDVALMIGKLRRDDTPRGAAERNIKRTVKFDGNQTGRIVGVVNERKRERLCYLVVDSFGQRSERPVESVEVVS